MKKLIWVFMLLFFINTAICAQENASIFHQEITWSPDGKSLSFTVYRKPDSNNSQVLSEVYVIKADGTGLKKVTENAGWSSWSKNGRRILFSRAGEDKKSRNIFSAATDGSDLIRITQGENRYSHPSFSPNGKKIAFTSQIGDEKSQIYVMNADGSGIKKLTIDVVVNCINPMWSPDGKKIVYYAEKGDNKDQIWTMNADGSGQILLTNNTGHNIYPAWMPDGKKIIFSSGTGDEVGIYTMKADGSDRRQIGEIKSFYARFAPNGRKIAFISGRFPKTDIFIADADGSNVQKLSIPGLNTAPAGK